MQVISDVASNIVRMLEKLNEDSTAYLRVSRYSGGHSKTRRIKPNSEVQKFTWIADQDDKDYYDKTWRFTESCFQTSYDDYLENLRRMVHYDSDIRLYTLIILNEPVTPELEDQAVTMLGFEQLEREVRSVCLG